MKTHWMALNLRLFQKLMLMLYVQVGLRVLEYEFACLLKICQLNAYRLCD